MTFRVVGAFALVGLLCSGCGLLGMGGGNSPKGGGSKNGGASDGGASTPTLFVEGEVTLPSAFEPLKLGMSKAAAKKIDERFVKSGSIDEDRFEGVSFFTSWDGDNLGGVWLSFDDVADKRALERATAAWGEPLDGKYLDYEIKGWFNDDAGIMAYYKTGEMHIYPYVPMKAFLGDDEPFLTPLLGKKPEELKDIHESAKWDLSDDHLDLWPTAYGQHPGFTRVHYELDKQGKIKEYYYAIGFEWFASQDEPIRKALEDKYGEGQEKEGKNLLLRKNKPKIHIKRDDITNAWEVNVERPYL